MVGEGWWRPQLWDRRFVLVLIVLNLMPDGAPVVCGVFEVTVGFLSEFVGVDIVQSRKLQPDDALSRSHYSIEAVKFCSWHTTLWRCWSGYTRWWFCRSWEVVLELVWPASILSRKSFCWAFLTSCEVLVYVSCFDCVTPRNFRFSTSSISPGLTLVLRKSKIIALVLEVFRTRLFGVETLKNASCLNRF